MESKIEKLRLVNHDLLLDYDRIEGKINEIIDYLNSQAQPEERYAYTYKETPEGTIEHKIRLDPKPKNTPEEKKSVCDKHHKEICRECMHNGTWTFEDTPEEWSWKFLKGGCEPTDYSKQPKMEEELHDKLLEIWCGLLPTPSKVSFDPEPIRIRIEGTEKYVKQLLDEREKEVRKSVLKEVREWLFSYLDKLNKEEK